MAAMTRTAFRRRFLPAAAGLCSLAANSISTIGRGPSVREKLAALGMDAMPMTPAEFDAHIVKEIAADAALVKAAGIKPH